jgi:Right handed beta helix region
MNKFRFTVKLVALAIFTLAFATMAQAQATRTWVSGVGDDVNPCSRTAPCKTFAGAISKTAKDGEISVLDPGGFGTINITKSITINGTHGAGFGSILSALASFGIQVNITDVNDIRKTVRIVSLNVNGASSGTDGLKVLAGSNVFVEDCVFDGFTNRGINVVSSTSVKVSVQNTVVRNCAQSCIVAIPTGGTTTMLLDGVHAVNSTANSGYAQSGSVKSTLRDSFFAGNFSNGVFADGSGEMNIENCVISHNATGINMTAPAVARLDNSIITNNTTASINAAGQPQVSSVGTNAIAGNGANNLPTGPPINPS